MQIQIPSQMHGFRKMLALKCTEYVVNAQDLVWLQFGSKVIRPLEIIQIPIHEFYIVLRIRLYF